MTMNSCVRESRAWLHRLFRQSWYANFAWDVSWLMSYACNSQCEYCFDPHADAVPLNIPRTMETIVGFNPRYLNLTGGEIFIIPEIEGILKELRARCQKAYIFAVTNFHVHPEKLMACLPSIDCLLVSIDSFGAHNMIHRMIDGDVVMEKLRVLRTWTTQQGIAVRFLTNSVVTVSNYMHLEEFVRRMQRMIPGQEMGFTTVNPYTSPLSLGSNRDKAREVLSSIRTLSGEGYPVWFSELSFIIESSRGEGAYVKAREVDALKLPREVICRRQYFRVQVLPDGSVVTCKPHLHIDAYHRVVEEALSGRHYLGAFRLYLAMLRSLLIARHDPRCLAPCNCEYFMEGLFNERFTGEQRDAFHVFGGKFTRAEVEKVERFLVRNYGKGFPPAIRDALPCSRER